jgi:hypothetical protein
MLTPQDIKVIREIVNYEIDKRGIGYTTTISLNANAVGNVVAMSDDQLNEYWSNRTRPPKPPTVPPNPEGFNPVA